MYDRCLATHELRTRAHNRCVCCAFAETEKIRHVPKKMSGATEERTIRVTTLGIAGGSGSGKVIELIAVDVL